MLVSRVYIFEFILYFSNLNLLKFCKNYKIPKPLKFAEIILCYTKLNQLLQYTVPFAMPITTHIFTLFLPGTQFYVVGWNEFMSWDIGPVETYGGNTLPKNN